MFLFCIVVLVDCGGNLGICYVDGVCVFVCMVILVGVILDVVLLFIVWYWCCVLCIGLGVGLFCGCGICFDWLWWESVIGLVCFVGWFLYFVVLGVNVFGVVFFGVWIVCW